MTDKEKKKCKYMISILGEQILDDESDRIEVLTEEKRPLLHRLQRI